MSGSYRDYEERQREARRQREKKQKEDLETSAFVLAHSREALSVIEKEREAKLIAYNKELNERRARENQKSTTQGEWSDDDTVFIAVLAFVLVPFMIGAILGIKLDLTKLQAVAAIWGSVAIITGILIYLRSKGIQKLRPLGNLALCLGVIAGLALLITIGWIFAINGK